MTKELLCLHKDVNHEICSLVAMTEKVLQVLDHKLHVYPALGRIEKYFFRDEVFLFDTRD